MSYILPIFSLVIAILLGVIVTKKISIIIPKFSEIFYIVSIGLVLFTAITYFFSLIFSFPTGIIASQIIILAFEVFYILQSKINLNFLTYFYSVLENRSLILLIITIGTILLILFNHHILLPIKGDLYTGESTYGDLPFHISTISSIVYVQKFPPDNPMYTGTPLVYPYLINFFSAILVYEGLSLRLSVVIPGLILSLSLVGIIYDLTFALTKNNLKSFLTVLFYFFNGGLGFYFFLKDYSFNFINIIQILSQPTEMKEYSHLFEQNIQWGNFLSRMIVPERALLFGLPTGIIIFRLLFFRGTENPLRNFDLILIAFLVSLMPLLHSHTVLAMIIILPTLGFALLRKNSWRNQIKNYFIITLLTVLFALPHIALFLNHLSGSEGFFRWHIGWMKKSDESIIWFWFKNTYLFIPLSIIALAIPKLVTKQIKSLLVSALILFIIINVFLFSPYDWDNVKFLFWIGMFFSIASGVVIGYFLQRKNIIIKLIFVFITISMTLTAILSIYREVNIKYVLFSKEAVSIGETIRQTTPADAVFLTYKLHNSPVTNLAGRSILMGYPGLLWTQGINYQEREKDINKMYAGEADLKLFHKYNINYVVVESYDPTGLIVNRQYFSQFPLLLKTTNYTVYSIP